MMKIRMKSILAVSLLMCFSFISSAWSMRGAHNVTDQGSAHFQEYLNSLSRAGAPAREREFNSQLVPLAGDYSQYQVDNVFVLFDTSGSTQFASHTGRNRGGGGGGRFSSSSSSLLEDPIITGVQTKHIALAQLEGLSLALKYLAQTPIQNAHFYLVGFSSTAQRSQQLEFPQLIQTAQMFQTIAETLPEIMPKPQFQGTLLGNGLEEILHSSVQPGNSLLILVTDGQTNDALLTAQLLSRLSSRVTEEGRSGHRFDILTIGAGSITANLLSESSSRSEARRNQPMTAAARQSCFLTRGRSAGSECDLDYLESLTAFVSPLGKGRYSGAYGDYSDLNKVLSSFFSGEGEGSYCLFIQSDVKGRLWPARSYQYRFINEFLSQESHDGLYVYNHDQYKVNIQKNALSGLIQVTDEAQQTRSYLWEQASQLIVQQHEDGTVRVTSQNPEIQKIIHENF